MKFYYCIIIQLLIAFFGLIFSVFAKREVIDFEIEEKHDDPDWQGVNTLDDGADPCQFLSEEEAPPTARDIFGMQNSDEDLVPTGIDIEMPDGTMISRLEHHVGEIPVWNSGATVVRPRLIRGLCAGPAKLKSTLDPVRLLRRATRSADNISGNVTVTTPATVSTWVSIKICMEHWLVKAEDEIYENSTIVYMYRGGNDLQTEAHQVEIRGLDYAANVQFRVFCLIDAAKNQTIKSWDGLQTFFGFGGNSKTTRYRYGDIADPLHPQLPSVNSTRDTCFLKNRDGTVIVYDMKSKVFSIVPGVTPVASYNCATGPNDSVNGAYSPLDDCFFNANKTVQFLLDPEWGFSTDIKKYVPDGVFIVGAHYGFRSEEFLWDGSALYFGDGGTSMLPMCTCEDAVAHEMGHAVTSMTSKLTYAGEPGCLNEAFSDIMAEAVQYYYRGSTDFKIGAFCTKSRPYLRDMSQPMSFNTYKAGDEVHTCSGIFNHAFYKLANSPGWGVQDAWKVFLNANAAFWKQETDMKQGACDVAVSASRYGNGGDRKYVIEAFKAVDIDVSSCMPAGTPAPQTARPARTTATVTLPMTTIQFTVPIFTMPDWMTWVQPRQTNTPSFFSSTRPPNTDEFTITTLTNCADVNELSADEGQALYFKVLVPDNAVKMNIFIDARTGDADLYVKQGSMPSLTSYDYRPSWKGSTEWVRTNIETKGWYFIMINATKAFQSLSIDACFI